MEAAITFVAFLSCAPTIVASHYPLNNAMVIYILLQHVLVHLMIFANESGIFLKTWKS